MAIIRRDELPSPSPVQQNPDSVLLTAATSALDDGHTTRLPNLCLCWSLCFTQEAPLKDRQHGGNGRLRTSPPSVFPDTSDEPNHADQNDNDHDTLSEGHPA